MVETCDAVNAVSDGFHVMMSRISCHDSSASQLIAGQSENCAATVQHSAKRESRVVRGGNEKWTQRCSVKTNCWSKSSLGLILSRL